LEEVTAMVVSKSQPRRVVRAVAFCVLVSLSPVAVLVSPAVAQSPVTSVAGLAQGARGDAVRQVQQALINQGIPVAGGVDGIFGAGTAAALRQFQTAKGLAATGVVDDATALALGLASSPVLGLTQGVRGSSVTQLQERLISAGIPVRGGADGIFGAATADAVKQFQAARGLPATGVVDAATAAALGSVQVPSSNGPSTGSSSSNTGSPSSGSTVGLKIGSRGDAVKQLQQQLIASGHRLVGGADGVFGVITASALSAFQSSAGLKPTAVVDEATAAALAAAPQNGSGSSGGQGATSPLLGLKVGSVGSSVKTLQETLIKAGVNVRGGADGVFGLATQNALRQYQQAAGLEASGRVDAQTASALASGRSVAGGGSASGLVGLRAGSLGTSVRELQQALIKAGVNVRGGADGIFGPATAQALSAFQTSQGLPATGVADAATVAALANPKPVAGGGGGGGAATGGFAQFGEKGARVTALQSALVKAGINVRGGVDGSFGAGTSAAVMDFQRANGLRVTGRVDEATAARLGLGAEQPPAAPDVSTVTLAAFPVQGRCYFTDTWMASRSGGRAHLGVDIIAPQGKLIYAVTDGTITRVYTDHPGSLAGNGVRLTQGDGTYFFYAHMVSIAEGITVGSRVKAGQVIGYVGSTGSSATNHLHFEVHPKGGSAVNPYPMVKAIDGCARTEPLPQ
jgi:peptidoglycan hydrolase-like protein with peptidoglycan-binding domain